MSTTPTPLGAIARGLAAGVAGTAVMTATQELAARLRPTPATEGTVPPVAPADPWESASTPAKLAKRVLEGVFEQEVPPERIPFLTNAMHWRYGTRWGAVYGVVAGTFPGRSLRRGLAFGTSVWVMAYVQLVPLGLYELPWKYPLRDEALELGYHLAYGTGVNAAFALLARGA